MDYTIKYSNRRTVSLMIKDGALIVKAPYGVSRRYLDKVVSDHALWVERSIERQKKKEAKFNYLTDEDVIRLREKAKIIIRDRVEYYSKIMGLNYGRITITSAKTRFGSCSSKGNLSFSYRLMLYPDEAVDYVVVHELAHLREMNHSKNFYKIIEQVLPDYKERRKLLKK